MSNNTVVYKQPIFRIDLHKITFCPIKGLQSSGNIDIISTIIVRK